MHHFISVMWQPQRSFARLSELKVSWLIGSYVLIEVLLSITILDVYSAGIDKAMLANPALTASSKPWVIAVSILIGSLIPVLIIALSALVFMLVTLIAGQTVRYRTMVGMLTLASAPMLASKFLRNLCYLCGVIPSVYHSALPLSLFLPGVGEGLLARALLAFDVFDLVTAVLTVVGFHRVSGLRRGPAYAIALVLWALLQLLLFRIHVAGAAQ